MELPRANLCGPRVFRPMQLKKWGRQPSTRLEVLGFGTVAEVSKMTLVVASLSIDGLQAEIHLPRMLAQLVRLCTLLLMKLKLRVSKVAFICLLLKSSAAELVVRLLLLHCIIIHILFADSA